MDSCAIGPIAPFQGKDAAGWLLQALQSRRSGMNPVRRSNGIHSVLRAIDYGSFRPQVGLWAGLILSSSLMFVVIARAATLDSALIFCTTLSIWAYARAMPKEFWTDPLRRDVAEFMRIRTESAQGDRNSHGFR